MKKSSFFYAALFTCFALFSLGSASDAISATYTVPTEFNTIQGAIDAAVDGDVILVEPGTYYERLSIGKSIDVRSTQGAEATIIDAEMIGWVVYMYNNTYPALTGFTITNGGGGLYINWAKATVSDCVITNNSGAGGVHIDNYACGVYLNNVEISNNYSTGDGGGVYGNACCTQISNSRIINNVAAGNGGGVAGVAWCGSIGVVDSVISGNVAGGGGGGLFSGYGGSSCAPAATADNCLIENNTAATRGGGAYASEQGRAYVRNSTVVGNHAPEGGGYWAEDTVIYFTVGNSIIWGNDSASHFPPQIIGVNYSDIEGEIPPGVGNISADPLFMDPLNGDYRLQIGSPAIDAASEYLDHDLLGTPRPQGAGYDMGAYEKKVYLLTPSAGPNGSISPAGAVSVYEGAGQAFTITPNTNCRIVDVLVDGVSKGPVPSYLFGNVTADHTISATFALYTAVTVIQPNGGEVLASGSTALLTWGAPTTAVKFNLSYSLDNGKSYTTIANGVTGYSYSWKVPAPAANTTTCKVKVIGLDSRGKTVGTDISNGAFTIEVIRVNSPNGGEVWQAGSTQNVTWVTNATSKAVTKVTLSYSTNSGGTWTKIVDLTTNPGSYAWKIPLTVKSTTCRIKVDLYNSRALVGSDTSNANFSIQP